MGKVTDKGGAKMWRGTAVEDGFVAALRGGKEPLEVALRSYELNCAGELTDEIEEQRELIKPMLEQALIWQTPGPLNAAQLRVEYHLPQVVVPVVGYLDMGFEGIDVDLKNFTEKCPSAARPEHVRQVSLYRAARDRSGGLLYVASKRHAYYEVDDQSMDIALEEMRAAALSLQNFLARCESREDVLKSLPVDWSNWQAPKTRVSLSEVLLAG